MSSPRGRLDQLSRIGRDWTKLGQDDPFWAVCVDPDRRGGGWDLEEFMASGQAEIAVAMGRLDELGLDPARTDALDFGCGVGRLTAALSEHFGSVTGVDISAPMLDRARSLLAGRPGCAFLHNERTDLSVFPDASFDLVYSSLVLQHVPRVLAAGYLADFIRVVRPGGAVVIVVPEAHRRTPSGIAYAYLPKGLVSLIQRKIFGYPAAMQMNTLPARRVRELVGANGARLAASDPRSGIGEHWRMTCHFIVKNGI
jgi:ubiquinone/menaquinone biosynthesis C-methylase UbiE